MQKENIAFFYLKTGGGHLAGARAICERMKILYPENNYFMFDILKSGHRLGKLFAEKGYFFTSNYFELGYVYFYQVTNSLLVLNHAYKKYSPFIQPTLRNLFLDYHITKVVCVHEMLTPFIVRMLKDIKAAVPFVSIVMDPFTAHNSWFYNKHIDLIVFSKTTAKKAIEQFHHDKDKVHVFNPIISDKFSRPYSNDEKSKVKQRLHIDKDKKVLLIAGGGEGLKNADVILSEFLSRGFTDEIVVVCGKNAVLKKKLEALVAKHAASNVIIFGFVDFMVDLMNIADCVVSKGGPGTIFETLSIGKPLIICSFVRGQEYGNVFFVEQNDVGWFIKDPPAIYEKVQAVFKNPEIEAEIQERIKNLNIKSGVDDIAKFIAKL